MSYKITFEPLNRISGVVPTTVEIETAAKAWKEVDGLMRSDERVTIVDVYGHELDWQQLKILAEKESK